MRRHLKPKHYAEASRERMLQAATRTFARHGYEGTTVRMIAEEAETAVGAVSYHWGGKEGLWQAVCIHNAEGLAAILKESVDFNLPPKEFLPKLVDGLFNAFYEHQDMLRIVIWATLEADAMDYDRMRGVLAPLITFGADYWQRYQASGYLQVDDLELALMHFRAVLVMTFVDRPGHRHNFNTSLEDPAHRARVRRSLLHAAFALLGAGEVPSQTRLQPSPDRESAGNTLTAPIWPGQSGNQP